MLPTFSLDGGLIFERQASYFGNAMTQTLEPRLFYVRTPYKNQDDIPNFDTGIAGFNYAQLFTENRFVGADKVSDANQLTAARRVALHRRAPAPSACAWRPAPAIISATRACA